MAPRAAGARVAHAHLPPLYTQARQLLLHSLAGFKLELFTQSLLDLQQYADLADLIDGRDLDEAWGETYLQLEKPAPVEYIRKNNGMIARSLLESLGAGAFLALLSEGPRPPRDVWRRIVSKKHRMINDELPRDRYLTRFRKVGSRDPRENKEQEV